MGMGMEEEVCVGRIPEREPHLEVRALEIGFPGTDVLRDATFTVGRGDVFVIMGGSGSGKSTLLRSMIGLHEPRAGEVLYEGRSFTRADAVERARFLRRVGVLYQRGALWSSMTVAENVALVLGEFTRLSRVEIRELVKFKLALVGLAGLENRMPGELSGGMQKRAGIARAMALDPEILFLDEPSAGLDPITARRLDELLLALRASLKTTLVLVSHDLDSVLSIGDNSIVLDGETKSIVARGEPRDLLERCTVPRVQAFLRRAADPARDFASEGVR
jgi:phospholipid/cholesterol/gamma-HCH transport system ATP-binding protein